MDTPQNKDVPAGQWPPTFVGVTMLFCFPFTLFHSITLSLRHFLTLSLKKTARWAVFRCTISRILYCPGAVITTAIGVASIINLHPMLPPDVKPSTRPLVGTL